MPLVILVAGIAGCSRAGGLPEGRLSANSQDARPPAADSIDETIQTNEAPPPDVVSRLERLRALGRFEEFIDGALRADPKLVFEPAAPDVATLSGGSDKVTDIGVKFQVGLKQIKDNTSVSVRFSKDANAVVEDADARLMSAANALGSVLEDPARDVAFAVDVEKTGITNDDLGDNTVTMAVNRQWYDEKIAEGKSIAITKFSDSGARFTKLATCQAGLETAKCSASFTGIAGGFSVFVLMGVKKVEATPTATAFVAAPTATATARPTATATVNPTSTSVPPTATATQVSSVTIAVVEPTSTATRSGFAGPPRSAWSDSSSSWRPHSPRPSR
ncbi:MAG: hypothetical protein IIA67_13880 [Planctomycetes bacterium]|nr:hypothetical protein [Planctomycetota bacterium]